MRGVRRHISLMRHTQLFSFAKNALWSLFVALLAIGSTSCKDEKDEPDNPLESKNEIPQVSPDSYSVVINSDGTATGGAVFSRQTESIFYLDYVRYRITSSHLDIIGCDRAELPSKPKLYAEVTLEGALYKTREISYGAFQYTDKIESIVIPKTVTTIGQYTFSNCTSLRLVTLPDGLTSMGEYCFNGCDALSRIIFKSDLPFNVLNWRGLYSISSKPVAYVPKEFLTNYEQSKFAKCFSEIIGY